MIRVLTYNVHRWVGIDRKISLQRTAAVIAGSKADVVALQEVRAGRIEAGERDQAEELAKQLGMDLHIQPTIRMFGEQYGLAILTKLPSRKIKGERLPTASPGPKIEKRSALWVEVTCGRAEVQFVNAHLSLRSGDRLAQAHALMGPDWLGHPDCQKPALLMGDLNAPPRSRAYKLLSSKMRDAQLAIGMQKARPTFHTRIPLARLDHIFLNGEAKILSAEPVVTPLSKVASDHLPLMASLSLASLGAEHALRKAA